MGNINNIVRRSDGTSTNEHMESRVNLGGSDPHTLSSYEKNPDDAELGVANGREGNDYAYPDASTFLINPAKGKRYQDFANSHLSEGEEPGRIPRDFTNKIAGVVDGHEASVVKANQLSGGDSDQAYIQHINVPRGSTLARAYSRTVDDSAPIPAIFISDPTRR